MKKAVSVCMTAVMALSLLAGGAVQASALSAKMPDAPAAVSEENCVSGFLRGIDKTVFDTETTLERKCAGTGKKANL